MFLAGSGVAPRPKGWIAAAAGSLSARALAPEEWSGYDAAASTISQSEPALLEGDAGCKYICVSAGAGV